MRNRVKELYTAGKVAVGPMIKFAEPGLVEIAGTVGSDLVSLDPYHFAIDHRDMRNMVNTAYSYGMTTTARCRNDPWEIMNLLDMGVQFIHIPTCNSAADLHALVDAVHYPPKGKRVSNRPIRFRDMSDAEYFAWSQTEVIVGVQIETREGLENLKEILAVPELDVVMCGPGDLSLSLGTPTDRYSDQIIELRKRIYFAALDAGKQICNTFRTTSEGLDQAAWWIEHGMRIVRMEPEYQLMRRSYAEMIQAVKQAGDT
ncbi:4-hydroxy-2-oxoheptanedioate aldolase [Aminobacter niigataensis]|uniref:4-hydroxy-2-oxoheptanedioate aldolase n=1 Tax=Aminobacter niigataensis TaxID=83265 RepID=A0ABR6L1D5_9HYPH|nr:aldolase/citrate lyase family protein [Aminobacter niigataensis]MBB4650585.1 4-hydroxy-2-oxoheptanedioate aldolase [Aminobacter niigataensis]